jgi:beta-carotene hydroxylase
MLRYKADLRTLLWMLVTPVTLVVLWRSPELSWWLYGAFLYLSIAAAIVAHNHNHVRTWKNRFLNHVTDVWISLFYGLPIFVWIPTHNKNHHRFNNTEPDDTHTWRFWESNSLFTLLVYPAISGFFQQPSIVRYFKGLHSTDRRQFWACVSQMVCLVTWVVAAFVIDWRKALIFVVIPQQVSLTSVLIFNYLQHVHADEEDEWNHSRNMTGWLLNALFFNNGYHTVHHHQPGLHWSLTPAAHRKIEHEIDPSLNEPSLPVYLVRTYILAPFIPSLRRRSMRLARQASQVGF